MLLGLVSPRLDLVETPVAKQGLELKARLLKYPRLEAKSAVLAKLHDFPQT